MVKYPFRAERNYHLDLEEGDLVLVLDKEEYGWWRGMIGERQGWFPAEMLQGCMFCDYYDETITPHLIPCCYTGSYKAPTIC